MLRKTIMVSLENTLSHSHCSTTRCTLTRPYYYTPPPSSATITHSMRTIRSNIFHPGPIPDSSPPTHSKTPDRISDTSTDTSGELHHRATLPDPYPTQCRVTKLDPESCIDSLAPEDLHPTVKACVDALQSPSIELSRSAAAAKLRLLAKNRADYRVMIGESGAIPALIPLLRCSDPMTQEHAVTALFNLSLHESNKALISTAVRSLIYALKTGTETSKQNAACAILSVALTDEKKLSIGVCGAIPPLVALLFDGSSRGKKDALTTLYKLCSVSPNKERTVAAGAVPPILALVAEHEDGLTEKAMVVLSSLAGIETGREAIVAENGIGVLVEAIEDGSNRGKEFAVSTLLQLCGESMLNMGLLVGEGGIPPLVWLSHRGRGRAKQKAETLLRYMREARQEKMFI